MKYPWVSLSILSIWAASAIIIIARSDAEPAYILGLTLVSTIILVAIGFRAPK